MAAAAPWTAASFTMTEASIVGVACERAVGIHGVRGCTVGTQGPFLQRVLRVSLLLRLNQCPMHCLSATEREILLVLDKLVRLPRMLPVLNAVAARLEDQLSAEPLRLLTWEPVDLSLYGTPAPPSIRSSWMFALRANTVSGAERHPNSIQRVMSWRGSGDLQTRKDGNWISHPLVSRPDVALEKRWLSIPAGVWHQGVMGGENWVVVSFHTVIATDLIEERPGPVGRGSTKRYYVS